MFSRKKLLILIIIGAMLFSLKPVLAGGPIDGEVVVFDVTDNTLSVLWQVDGPSQCDLELYDASDTLVDVSSYGKYIDSAYVGQSARYPGYSKAEEYGVMVVTLYNLSKNTEYHIRTVTIPMTGDPIIYPAPGDPAIAVRTMIMPMDASGLPSMPPVKNSDRWMEVYDSDSQPAEGAIALIYVDGASNPVSNSKPGETKDSWVAYDGLVSVNLRLLYNASTNANFLELFNAADAGIDATVKVYGGSLGMWERRVEDFWGKTDDWDDLLYDGVNYTVVLEGAAPLPVEPLSVDAGADQTAAEGDAVSFTVTSTGGSGTYTSAWDFGDGGAATGETATHVYADNGVYTVQVTVTDDETSASDTLTVTVSNVAPEVDAGANQAVNEGDEVSVAATVTDAGSADTHTIAWNFGDGGTASGMEATHVYADNNVYTVSVTVTDDDGASATDTLTVTVSNVAPEVDAGANQAVNEGDEVSVAATVTDAGSADTHTIAWDFGDGGAATGETATHVYADNGEYTVTVTVTDDETSTTDTLTVTVSNVAPVVDAGADQTVNEGDEVSVAATVTDAGSADTHTVEWDFGDGSTATGMTATHVYTADDILEYNVTVTVTDDDGASATDTLTVTITEIIDLTVRGPYTFTPGLTLFALPPFESFYDETDQLITMDAQTMLEKTGASTIYGFDKSDPENPQWMELAADDVLDVGTGYFILRESNDSVECSFRGTLLADPILPDAVDLTVGLNLVSVYDPDYTYNSEEILTATEGDRLYQWKNGLWQPPYTTESDPAEIFEIDPATAYFIYIE